MTEAAIPPLFDRLPPGLFRLLGAENGPRYWDVMVRLLDQLWGEGGRSPGEEAPRPAVVRAIESLLAADDPWEEDLATPVAVRAHTFLNFLIDTGWLSQRQRGIVDMVTIRPVVAQFYTVLSEFALHEPAFIASQVRSIHLNLSAVASGDAGGDQYREAAKQAKQCMAHIVNTGWRVQELMTALLKRTSAREFVAGFFEDYIQKVFIADYSELRTRDHPLQYRSQIIARTLQFQNDADKRDRLVRWYQDKLADGDRIKADLLYERDTRLLLRLRDVEHQLQRLDEEIREANQKAMVFIEYKLRAPKHLDKLIDRALSATTVLEEGAIALPPAPKLRHASRWGLAKPRSLPTPSEATAVERAQPTLAELAMQALRRRMAEARMVKPVQLANYVLRHLMHERRITSDALTIESINDLCCYQRLLLMASRADCPAPMRRSDPILQTLKRVRVYFDPTEITRNAYMEHQRFIVQREQG